MIRDIANSARLSGDLMFNLHDAEKILDTPLSETAFESIADKAAAIKLLGDKDAAIELILSMKAELEALKAEKASGAWNRSKQKREPVKTRASWIRAFVANPDERDRRLSLVREALSDTRKVSEGKPFAARIVRQHAKDVGAIRWNREARVWEHGDYTPLLARLAEPHHESTWTQLVVGYHPDWIPDEYLTLCRKRDV